MPDSCNPMDCTLPGYSVPGISQARLLEWVVFLSPGDLPDTGVEPRSPALQVVSLPTKPPELIIKEANDLQNAKH